MTANPWINSFKEAWEMLLDVPLPKFIAAETDEDRGRVVHTDHLHAATAGRSEDRRNTHCWPVQSALPTARRR